MMHDLCYDSEKPITREQIRKLREASTSGWWYVATGCSWRRILQVGTDKPVILPTIHHRDNWPDLNGTEADMELAAAAPQIADAYLAEGEPRGEIAHLLEENAKLQQRLDMGENVASLYAACMHPTPDSHAVRRLAQLLAALPPSVRSHITIKLEEADHG